MIHLLCLLVSRVVGLRQRICAAICSSELVAFGMDIAHCSIAIRLGISMFRHSTDICVISGSRGVNIIFGHIFVTTLLCINIRKHFA